MMLHDTRYQQALHTEYVQSGRYKMCAWAKDTERNDSRTDMHIHAM